MVNNQFSNGKNMDFSSILDWSDLKNNTVVNRKTPLKLSISPFIIQKYNYSIRMLSPMVSLLSRNTIILLGCYLQWSALDRYNQDCHWELLSSFPDDTQVWSAAIQVSMDRCMLRTSTRIDLSSVYSYSFSA